MPLSPKKKAKADAERREREKYAPGTSARLPLPYKPSPEVAKWLTTEKRHWAEDAVAEALAREPVKCCLAPDWKDEFTGKDIKHELEWPAPPEGYQLGVTNRDFPRESRAFGDVSMEGHHGFLSRAARARQYDGITREWFPERGDKVEVHTHGVWRKGSVRKVNYGRLCPGRPPDVRYDVHLESEGAWLPDEIDHLKRVFRRVDEDGSGEIDRDELQKLLIELEHPLALDDYCVDDLFRRTDKDGSGHIDFPEFCDLVYVELHDDIGLPHTLYNVESGVLPSLSPRWRRGPATRLARAATASVASMASRAHAVAATLSTTQVPHRKLRREPWKFGKPQNIFATKRGPLKTLLAVHHKGIRVRKKAFQKARTDTMCLPHRIREPVTEITARQMIPNRQDARKALARDPFHPDNRDIYCRKQLRYAAKPPEKRITHVVTVRDNFLGGAIILPDKCFDGLEYPLANQDRHRHVYGKKKYSNRDVNPLNAKAPSSLVKGRSFSPPKLPKKERRKLSYDDDWGGSVEETEKREAEEREQAIIKERSRYTVSQELLDGVAQANASSAPFYGSQIVRGENNRWILQKMDKPDVKRKKKKEAAVDPSLLIGEDKVPTAGYTYV